MGTKTQTPEEAREERRERTRAQRIKAVHDEITKAKTGISTVDIAVKTGYSKGIVASTIRLVNRTMGAISGATKGRRDAMYAFKPHGVGWVVAHSWEQRATWHVTLHRHVTTRCESLKAEADVAEGLWPGGAPAGLSAQYGTAIYALDQAGGLIDSLKGAKGKSPKPKPVKRGVRQVG